MSTITATIFAAAIFGWVPTSSGGMYLQKSCYRIEYNSTTREYDISCNGYAHRVEVKSTYNMAKLWVEERVKSDKELGFDIDGSPK